MFQGCPHEKETAFVRRLVISSPPGQKEKRRGFYISLYLLPNPSGRTGSRKPVKSHQLIGCHLKSTQTDRPKSARNRCVY